MPCRPRPTWGPKMHTRVPAYSGPQCSNISSAVVASSQSHNAKRTRAKCTQALRFTPAPQCGNISSAVVASSQSTNAKRTRAKCTPAPQCSNISSAMVASSQSHNAMQNAHAQNAYRRSGLLRPPNVATLAAQWSQSSQCTNAKRTCAKCIQALRFTPAPHRGNISSAVVASSQSHNAKRTRAKCTQALRFTPAPQCGNISSAVVASSQSTNAKRTRAKCTQALRFTPAPQCGNISSAVALKERLEPNIWWLLGIWNLIYSHYPQKRKTEKNDITIQNAVKKTTKNNFPTSIPIRFLVHPTLPFCRNVCLIEAGKLHLGLFTLAFRIFWWNGLWDLCD